MTDMRAEFEAAMTIGSFTGLRSSNQEPTDMTATRRKRSELSRGDCLLVLEQFAKRVNRFAETTNGASFGIVNEPGISVLPRGQINVMFAVVGGFGVAEDLFEAIRVLGGHKLPATGRAIRSQP